MAIYRADQVRLSIASETGLGGYVESVSRATLLNATTINQTGGIVAGNRSVVLAATASYVVGDYVQIEASSAVNVEIRRIVRVDSSAETVFVDYPFGFNHANGVAVARATAGAFTGTNYITVLPGVYETIQTPDLQPELIPQYYLKTTGDRNWSYIYQGKQSFQGSLPNFILLNGIPLRFPIGRIRTITTAVEATIITTSAAATRGDMTIVSTNSVPSDAIVEDEYIVIDDAGINPEVRQVVAITIGGFDRTITLNYPLSFSHSSGVSLERVSSGTQNYTHTIIENSELDSLSWHLLLRDSDETVGNDFIRRFVGGVVNRASISAEEGGLLRMSFDEVPFMDLVHNQTEHSSLAAGAMPKSSSALLAPPGIGNAIPSGGVGVLGTPAYPTTEPYYFSQGSLSLFGITFARVRRFSLSIQNGVTPRYYISDLGSSTRGPADMQEGRREYRLSATIALPDSVLNTATTRTLWKELILEGNYGSGMNGFQMQMTFIRGSNDTITLVSPSAISASAATPGTILATPTTGFESQGCFFNSAPHPIGQESPIEINGEIIIRNLGIQIVDQIPIYI